MKETISIAVRHEQLVESLHWELVQLYAKMILRENPDEGNPEDVAISRLARAKGILTFEITSEE